MGRERCDDHHIVTSHSSIALLQERFRQLQRVKEMREERELLRMLHKSAESERCSRLFFQSEPPPPRPPPAAQVSGLSLCPNLHITNHCDIQSLAMIKTCHADTHTPSPRASSTPTQHYSDSDVDTSLHL